MSGRATKLLRSLAKLEIFLPYKELKVYWKNLNHKQRGYLRDFPIFLK